MTEKSAETKKTWFFWGFPWWWWLVLIGIVLVVLFLVFR
jgi:hypothetical protein